MATEHDPILLKTMRDHPECLVEVTTKMGTSARGFVAEYDEAIQMAQAKAWREGKTSEHDANCRLNAESFDDCICANPYERSGDD